MAREENFLMLTNQSCSPNFYSASKMNFEDRCSNSASAPREKQIQLTCSYFIFSPSTPDPFWNMSPCFLPSQCRCSGLRNSRRPPLSRFRPRLSRLGFPGREKRREQKIRQTGKEQFLIRFSRKSKPRKCCRREERMKMIQRLCRRPTSTCQSIIGKKVNDEQIFHCFE